MPNISSESQTEADAEADMKPANSSGTTGLDLKALLRSVGLRPTNQRMALGWLLFGKGNRHTTAEVLHLEAIQAGLPVSLATVYNTLNQFTDAGILRQLAFDGSKSFFDTNTTPHHHFFIEGENLLIDIANDALSLGKIPTPPEGYEITRIEVVIRLRKRRLPATHSSL
jgi:Fur family transcriptional regulator, iron response regulator